MPRQGGQERGLVRGVRSDWWNRRLVQWKVEPSDLGVEDCAADTVHADAIVVTGDGCNEADHLVLRIAPQMVKQERAVFAAAPRDDHWSP